ncbi:MAG: TraR/DksA family transcriptional regulator [Deltaproteobacteria bacterium]|nr:TraR/DksA family transcriptional regulator [Deltaproteobacteria bacterium]
MDVFDRAQQQEEFFRDKSLAKQLAKTRPAPGKTIALDCEDCGERIPEMRLTVNPEATRCIKCQTAFENKNKFGGAD